MRPTSRNDKLRKGTLQPVRDSVTADVIQFPSVEKHPDPPAWMNNKYATELWNKLVPLLMTANSLTIADLDALGHLCRLHGSVVRDYERDVEPTAAILTQLRLYFESFGLTSASRNRVKKTTGEKQKNKFSNNSKTKGKG